MRASSIGYNSPPQHQTDQGLQPVHLSAHDQTSPSLPLYGPSGYGTLGLQLASHESSQPSCCHLTRLSVTKPFYVDRHLQGETDT